MLAALDVFREVHPTAPLHLVTAYLRVCVEEGLGVKDYAEQAGVANTVMSRHLLDLGSQLRSREPGLGLVENEQDPQELRRYRMSLTHRGHQLALRMLARLSGNGKARKS